MKQELTQHTPGPWEVSELYADDEGQPELAIRAKINGMVCHPAAVCLQFPNMPGMQMANARLIAAAPELLAALKIARQFMNVAADWNMNEVEINGQMGGTYDWLKVVDKAITQAVQP
jgi:hypothetical protein